MKKMLVCLCLLFAMVANAQGKTNLKDIKELTFFGVDFSQAKVIGADETVAQFKDAFTGINNLFLREPKKYNTEKAFNAKVTTDLTPSLNVIDGITKGNLYTQNENYAVSDEQIAASIAKLNVGEAKGVGAIIVTGLINKGKNNETLHVVLFDIETRDVIFSKTYTEGGRGFGLRNFWAYPVYKVLGKVKKEK